MSIDKRLGTKVPSYTDKDRVTGYKRDSGPHIGIVKNNADPTRAGRLQVFIPNFGGNELEPSHWVTVGYANPYMGAARTPSITTVRSPDNEYTKVNHSYGMWFTPPDIGNQVLVTFIDGDINHGYWFACIMPDLSHWAIPGQAGAQNLETPLDATLAQALTTPPYPAVEFNETNDLLQQKKSNFLQINKPVHENQTKVLLKQGLEDDKVRGVVSSSSQRESPSKVFGISTPGQSGTTVDPTTGQVTYRLGGHTLVMDDGDVAGIDQLIRLRTAGGHQILMNDTSEIIYIGNKNGTTWLEFTGDGTTNLYSESDINVRSKKTINLHSDDTINMYAQNNINMYAGSTFKQQAATININAKSDLEMYGQKVGLGSGSILDISAATDGGFLAGGNLTFYGSLLYLNTTQPPSVLAPTNIPIVSQKESTTTMAAPYFKWKNNSTVQSTIPITTPIPTHEPFVNHPSGAAGIGSVSTTSGSSAQIQPTQLATPNTAANAGQPGPDILAPAAGLDSKRMLLPSNPKLALQPKESTGMGILTAAQLTALKAQIAKSESNFNYQAVNQLYYMGKYQFGYQALITFGYANANTTSNYQLVADSNQIYWAGKDGITNSALWLTSPDVQEKVMNALLQQNYNYLSSHRDLNGNPVIDSSSEPSDVAGKLAICHLLGAGACVKWTNGQNPNSDANGTSATTYYNLGAYSITVVAPSIIA